MAMEQWLEMTEVNEISLVPDASNPHSDVAFVKAAKPAGEKVEAGFRALRDAVTAIGGGDGLTEVHKSKIIAALDNLDAVLGAYVPTASEDRVAKEKAMDEKEIKAALTTAEATIAKMRDDLAKALADLTAREGDIVKAKADLTKLQGDLDVAKAALPGAKDEDIYKGLPESIVNIMKADRASIAESKALIQKMGDDAEGAALATVLKAALVPDFDAVAPALLRIQKGRPLAARKVGDKDVAADVEIVKAALLAKSATARAPLTVVGSGAREDIVAKVGETEAEAKLKVAAETIQKAAKDGGGKMTYEAAFTQALDDNPALYTAYQKERAAR